MSFPCYPTYKDSGVEWLGQVPEHWCAGRFSRAILAIKDGTHGTFERVPEGRPLLSAKNVQDGYVLVAEDESMVSESDHLSITSNGFPQRGDLLLTIVGTIGRSCVYEFEDSFAFQRSVCFIRLLPGNETKFFYYFTQSKFFQEQLVSRSKSAAQGGVYMGDVVATSIVFPPLSEQTQIAAFLDRETAKIDGLVAEQRRLMALLKEKRQAVISHAVTQGLNPDAPMKPSGIEWLGDVPAHWSTPSLYMRYSSELGKMLDSSKITGDHLIPYTRNVDVQWGSINLDDLPYMDIREDEYERYTVKTGDLLVCEGGEVGRAAIVPIIDGVFGYQKALHRLRAVDENEIAQFMYFTLLWAAQTGIFDQSGSSTIAHLTGEQLRKYRFPKPPVEEQAAIAAYLQSESAKFDTLTDEAQRAIDLLQERRTTLISAAVTGQIDVRARAPLDVEEAACT